MADLVDMAAEIEAEHISAALGRISAAIPRGAAGICDECDEYRLRLVEGRCGFCRDGRVPPIADTPGHPSPAPPTPPVQTLEKEPAMPTPPVTADSQTISVPAKGAALAAIRNRAADDDLPLGRAALALIETALEHPAQAASDLSDDDLIDALRDRLVRAGMSATLERDLAEANARAKAAEDRIMAIQSALVELVVS